MLRKRLLHRTQLVRRTDPFDGGDFVPFRFNGEHRAGIDRFTIQQDRACPALSEAATELGRVKQSTDKFGKLVFALQTVADTSTTNRISKFSYTNTKGKMVLMMSGLTLSRLTNGVEQLEVIESFLRRTATAGRESAAELAD